jgi:antitoxin component HigA of HigAB toxin-antitoxin module
MFEEIAQAIKDKEYKKAVELIKTLRKSNPENPWLDFYTARLYELKGKFNEAKQSYNYLLKNSINPKLMGQIRQGIERIDQIEKKEKQQKQIEKINSKSKTEAENIGVFILESIPTEEKTIAAQYFGKIMGIDAYSARLQLPSRSWRLYRTGEISDLSYYVDDLQKGGIPCFYCAVEDIKQLSVYQVNYIESVDSEVTAVCQNQEGKEEILTFNWLEITKRVEALVPVFETSFKFGVRWEIYHTKDVLDYARFCDLYLPERKLILRICDHNYDFKQGINLVKYSSSNNEANQENTMRKNWQNFLQFIQQQLPNIPLWSDFTFFGETALDFKEFLSEIEPNIVLFRQEPSLWDQAFHLYSSLVFLKPI